MGNAKTKTRHITLKESITKRLFLTLKICKIWSIGLKFHFPLQRYFLISQLFYQRVSRTSLFMCHFSWPEQTLFDRQISNFRNKRVLRKLFPAAAFEIDK